MPFQVHAITVAADTNVQVAGPDLDRTSKVNTNGLSQNLKLAFVPTATIGVCTIAETSAKVTAAGFPLATNDPDATTNFQGTDEIELVAGDTLWVRSTVAGKLYVLFV